MSSGQKSVQLVPPASRPPWLLKYRSSTWLIAITVFIATFNDGFVYGVIVPVLPFSLVERSHVPPDQIQFWASTFLMVHGGAMLISAPIAGWLADNSSSRRLPFSMGLVLIFGATLLLLLATKPAILVIARLLQGSASGIAFTVGIALLVDTVSRKNAGHWMGFSLSGINLGAMVAPLLGGYVYENVGYYAVFALALGVIAVNFLLQLVLVEKKTALKWTQKPAAAPGESRLEHTVTDAAGRDQRAVADESAPTEADPLVPKQPATQKPSDWPKHSSATEVMAALLTSPRLMTSVYGSMINATLVCAFDGVLPLFVQRTFGWGSTGAGIIFLPITMPALLGPLVGFMADRFGTRTIALSGLALTTVTVALVGLVHHDGKEQVALLVCLLLGIGIGNNLTFTPLATDMSAEVDALSEKGLLGDSGAYAQAYGLFDAAIAAGALIGPLIAGVVYEKVGWPAMAGVLSVVCATGAIPIFTFTGGKSK